MDFHVTSIVIRQGQRDFKPAVARDDQDLRELVLGDDALLCERYRAHPPHPVLHSRWRTPTLWWRATARSREAAHGCSRPKVGPVGSYGHGPIGDSVAARTDV